MSASDLIEIKVEETVQEPEEIELQIQNGRILTILDTMISNVKLAICLPTMFTNEEKLITKHLSVEDASYVKNFCTRFLMVNSSRSTLGETQCSGISSYSLEQQQTDVHMKRALELLNRYSNLKMEVQNEYKFHAGQASMIFVEILQTMRGIVESKLKISAVEEINREKALNKAWREDKELVKHLSEVQKELDVQRNATTDLINSKNNTLLELRSKWNECEQKYKDDVRFAVASMEKWLVEDCTQSKEKQIDLASEAKAIQHQYENLLSQHMMNEKKLRARKVKIEQQLVSWLAKYDSDMTDRQYELDELTKGYNEEQEELMSLQKKFDEQYLVFQEISMEKDRERYRAFCEVLKNFVRKRCAKLIQKWWREILGRIREKRAARKAAAKAKAEKKKK